MSTGLISALVAGLSAAILLRAFAPAAARLGLVDHPQARKVHQQATPLVGGLAVFGGAVFGLLAVPEPMGVYRILFAAAGALLLVGLFDDLKELSPPTRFAAQIFAATAMVMAGGVSLQSFGHLVNSSELLLGALALPVTVFCAVGVINAINMADGVDGLAGGLVLIALGGLVAASLLAQQPVPLLYWAVMPSLFVFLLWNFRGNRPAAVFLGDAGTLWLGFLLAWLLIDHSQGPGALIDPVTALWLLAVPLMDTVYVMIERPRRGKSPFSAGQDHLHHLFLRAGLARARTVVTLWLLAVFLAGFGLFSQWLAWPQWLRFYAFLALSAGYYAVVTRAWQRRRWLGREVRGVASAGRPS
ncbi:MAG: undecaprenyl-phosphate alpha-N-acetylglucosaminyl 1-phosphate transferase [Pseudomonadota bacterium]